MCGRGMPRSSEAMPHSVRVGPAARSEVRAERPQKTSFFQPTAHPARACTIQHVPVWAFHGALDDVVPFERSEEMVAALRGCDGNVRFTVYPEARHDSWTATYANPELYAWLLAQRRPLTHDAVITG